jgi:hypothetical protein
MDIGEKHDTGMTQPPPFRELLDAPPYNPAGFWERVRMIPTAAWWIVTGR